MKVVLDTNVVVAGMRSPSGASAQILRLLRRGEIEAVANVALAIEYEAICRLPQHRAAAGLTLAQVDVFLDAVVAMMRPVETHFMWRPVLRDPADEFVLEAATNGQASTIVTFNVKDFTVAARFGLEVCKPTDLIGRVVR